MSVVAQIAAVVAVLVHLVVWVWEAFLIHRVHQSVFGQPASDVPAIRLWAFGVGFPRLELQVIPGNDVSVRVAERAGYQEEGLLRASIDQRGERLDGRMFSLLPGELVE